MIKRLMILTTLIFIQTLTSCSHKKSKKQKPQTPYSEDVQKVFSEIENEERKILDYYRELRAKNWNSYKQKTKRGKSSRSYSDKMKGPSFYKTYGKNPSPTPPRPPLGKKIVTEMMIEIRQHQSYYCMKNRRSKSFRRQGSCKEHTKQVYKGCQDKFPIIYDRKIINCVKNKLR